MCSRFHPITIDVDGPFGLAVCQPSTVPRPFVAKEVQKSKCHRPTIEESIGNLTALGELEEIYAECGNPSESIITTPETNYGARKMQTMPRPFSSIHCHDQHSAHARSFSVDMHHSFANSSLGHPNVRLGNTVLYHPDYSTTAPSTVSLSPSTTSRYTRKERKKIKTCCCIFGSHVATIIFTLFLVAGLLHFIFVYSLFTNKYSSLHI